MQWFKHDATANQDAKLKRLRMKYGLEGYGLYWYCLELIAGEVGVDNVTFELEHDAEIIAFDTGIHHERVNEMMHYMVDLGLFESSASGHITCMKLAKRLDKSMTSNPKMRAIIDAIRTPSVDHHDDQLIQSCKIRVDETRQEKPIREESTASSPMNCPHVDLLEVWAEVMPDKQHPRANLWKPDRKEYKHLAARWKEMAHTEHSQTGQPMYSDKQSGLDWWRAFFQHVRQSPFLMDDQPWFNLGWVVNKSNFYKIIEGNYHGGKS